jgi:integrase
VKVSHLHSNPSASRRTHDLRHTGNTLASRTKASTKDLMARMGHDSARAALIYQHATSEADQEIAAALSGLVDGERRRKASERPNEEDGEDGAAGALVPAG